MYISMLSRLHNNHPYSTSAFTGTLWINVCKSKEIFKFVYI